MADVKSTTVKTPNSGNTAPKGKSTNHFFTNLLIIALCLIIGFTVFYMVLGNASNFDDAEKKVANNFLGNMYHGGFVVGLLISTLFVTICFTAERLINIAKAKGKGNGAEFVRKIQYHLANKDLDKAMAECDRQSGSVGNVMKAGLVKYKEMINNSTLSTDEKVIAINAEIDEASALEMPMLERNLVFLSTITSAATLIGLFGTVLGMIRAFAAMGQAGAPDASALAGGISEALYNTATGIGTSIIAMIAYNYFTTTIDGVKYNIDEAGFTLGNSFKQLYS